MVDDPAKSTATADAKQAPQPAKETLTAAKTPRLPVPSAKEPASQPKELVPASRSDSKSAMKDVASPIGRTSICSARPAIDGKRAAGVAKRDTIRDPGIRATPAPKNGSARPDTKHRIATEHRLRQIPQERAGSRQRLSLTLANRPVEEMGLEPDTRLAKPVLYQLSYSPEETKTCSCKFGQAWLKW